jgi:hypothetical protein
MMIPRRKFLGSLATITGASVIPRAVLGAIADSVGIDVPRIGLIIGNSQYQRGPLLNPTNDAKAISATLAELGFQCQLLLDADLHAMSDAVQQYGARLASQKAIGLFYYAGHGAQLAWKNYLIPVDAVLSTLDDMPRKTLELNTLLSVLSKAANPMNVIILDACRDNPFGSGVPVERKGLSQFDAPPGSLLSYSTAPGNTASDGDGANGLFTENLLREMRVPGAKLEDVFKRVRLKVRIKSGGQQIPWESTSLEEDFYFSRTQEQLVKISEERKVQLFNEELAVWNASKATQTVASMEDYLARYPDGNFSQLAQVQLDLLLKKQGEKKVQISNAASNPFTKGTVSAVGSYSLGDSFTFEEQDALTGVAEDTFTEKVTSITESQIIFNDGKVILDLVGNELKSRDHHFLTPAQLYPAQYAIGFKWSTKYIRKRGNGVASEMELNLAVVSREVFTNQAGTFNAFKVTASGSVADGKNRRIEYWIDPDKCLRPLRFDEFAWKQKSRGRERMKVTARTELIRYTQKSS